MSIVSGDREVVRAAPLIYQRVEQARTSLDIESTGRISPDGYVGLAIAIIVVLAVEIRSRKAAGFVATSPKLSVA